MRTIPTRFLPSLIATLCCAVPAAIAAAASATSTPSFAAKSPDQVQFFDLTQVRLLEGPFKEAQDIDHKFLLSVDPSRLLLMFRVTAGLSSNAKPLGGWESPGVELRGHSLGHYLSACSLMYASTGDAALKKNVDFIVGELAACQASMPAQGYHAGYLSAFPESLFDRCEAGKPVWAPWYTMHKIMAGLYDATVHTGNTQALQVLENLAGWVKFRVDRLTPEQMQASLGNEHGGMTEVLANLAGVTHNPEYLRLSAAFNHRAVFDPLAHGVDALNRLHANTQIPKITGAAREYELTGTTEYRDIAQFFWQTVALQRSYAIGGDSDDEHFFPVEDFAKHLSAVTCETCNTYNMLKLTEHVFAWQPAAATMDFYERGLYNQILASQDPKTGMFEYFISMKPGHFKTYSTPENSFWCCVGTGMENHGKYGEAIYAHDDAALWVNLFIASQVRWPERGLVVRQETTFPDVPQTRLTLNLSKPTSFTVKLRQPGWAGRPLAVTVNGQAMSSTAPDASGYLALTREWRDGDRIEVTLPMGLRTETLPHATNLVAVFDGPILLAGDLGTDGMPPGGAYAKDQKDFEKWPAPAVPTLSGDANALVTALKPADQPLTFRSVGIGRPHDVTLTPFFRLHHRRYTIYWDTTPVAEAKP